jgi:hypothetical protein
MTVVLDASALLAYLKGEPGSEVVDGVLEESVISRVSEFGPAVGAIGFDERSGPGKADAACEDSGDSLTAKGPAQCACGSIFSQESSKSKFLLRSLRFCFSLRAAPVILWLSIPPLSRPILYSMGICSGVPAVTLAIG